MVKGSVPFFKRARISNALRAFDWVSGNWNLLKGKRRLPHVGLFESGRDIIGIRAVNFLNFLTVSFTSPVDVGNSFDNYLIFV